VPNQPPLVIDKVRAALADYQWTERSLMLHLAQHVGHSEFAVRDACNRLVELGEAEKVTIGKTTNNYKRIIFRLKCSEQ
jgi:DNA-binding transcriptional regulator PaaX